jgi:hypothetical protein
MGCLCISACTHRFVQSEVRRCFLGHMRVFQGGSGTAPKVAARTASGQILTVDLHVVPHVYPCVTPCVVHP